MPILCVFRFFGRFLCMFSDKNVRIFYCRVQDFSRKMLAALLPTLKINP